MVHIIEFLFLITDFLLTALIYCLIAGAILSFLVAFNVVNAYNPMIRTIINAIDTITEPVCRPVRRFMPHTPGLDLSPMVIIVLIYAAQSTIIPGFFKFLIRIFG